MQSPDTWDTVAAGYADEARRHAARYAEEALRRLPPEPGDHVLDLASGPGTLALLAAPRAARVTAVDFSAKMIDELRALAKASGFGNVEGTVMDSRALAFGDRTFDKAYCMFAFMFFPDRARCFSELLRVLRPGGRLLVGTWGPIERRPLMKLGFDALVEALPDAPRPQKGDLQSVEDCAREMTDAGFVDVSAVPFTVSARVQSAEEFVTSLERGGAPLAVLRKKLGETAWAVAHAKMLEVIRRNIPEGGADLSAEAILTVGTRRP